MSVRTYRMLLRSVEEILGDERKEDAGILIREMEGMTLSDYLLRMDEPVPEERASVILYAAGARASGVPLQHLTRRAPFYGRDFYVDGRVLVPRFDTEILTHEAICAVRERGGCAEVLDLCTGSGCIGITLKLECPGASVTLSDVSEDALAVASRNAAHFRAEVKVLAGDLFRDIPGRFDVIVSNPPYIPDAEIRTLSPEVRDHDPILALSGGPDGLSVCRRLVPEAYRHLRGNGALLVEIGHGQASDVTGLFRDAGFSGIRVAADLAGIPRVVSGLRTG
ncbi:MAG: peptide chain release factor N(5)-glutamine methyltransferase [Lachnospiraceae bacterium]|nr:peptide chain release factor N(5)-glutamine methyltransferase [Lachnospiraceae bacterium]